MNHGHSCCEIRLDEVSLLCDSWLFGPPTGGIGGISRSLKALMPIEGLEAKEIGFDLYQPPALGPFLRPNSETAFI